MRLKATPATLAIAGVCFAATLPTPRPHPRLQIDAALLQQIRGLRDRGDPAWKRLEKGARAHSQQAASIYSRISKPIHLQTLVETIERVHRQRHSADERATSEVG